MSTQLNDPDQIAPARLNRHKSSSSKTMWFFPVLLGLGCGLIGYMVCTHMTHWYKTTTTLYFPSTGNEDPTSLISQVVGKGVGGVGALLGKGAASGAGTSDSSGSIPIMGGLFSAPEIAAGPQTAIAVLDSNTCREAVARDCNLQQRWRIGKFTDVTARLQNVVSYGLDKNGLLAIEVNDPDPALAVQIANTYLSNLQRIATTLSTGFSRPQREFLERELARERFKLNNEEVRLVRMQSKKGHIVIPPENADKLADSYMDLQHDIWQAKISLEAAESQIKWATRTADATIKHSMELPHDVPVAQASRDELRDLEARYAYAKATLGPDNPDYNALKIQVETARQQVKDEVKREAMALKQGISPDVAMLFAERAGLQAECDGLDQANRQVKSLLTAQPSSSMIQMRLERNIKISEGLATMLTTETERARIAEARDSPTWVVVDAPEQPADPYMPRRSFVTMLCAVAGLLVGCGWLAAMTTMTTMRRAPALTDED